MTQSHRHRVLVVEDEADLREVYAETLELSGHQVRRAADGSEALATMAEGWVPCVLFLDLRMPGMDGWELARRMREDPELAEIPIVVIAAHFRIDREAREVGAAAWLQKPFDLGRLEELADRACRSAQRVQRGAQAGSDR